jgi:hypothetical protein
VRACIDRLMVFHSNRITEACTCHSIHSLSLHYQRIKQVAISDTQNTLVDSNNTRIIPSSHFDIKPLNQIHCSLFGLTRELAIALQ